MGSNIEDYIREAYRVLKLDTGHSYIIESTSRFKDLENFKKQLEHFGFMVTCKEMWKFTHIRAVKIKKKIDEELSLNF